MKYLNIRNYKLAQDIYQMFFITFYPFEERIFLKEFKKRIKTIFCVGSLSLHSHMKSVEQTRLRYVTPSPSF